MNCSQWQEWQDVGYVTAFMVPYVEHHDQTRRPDTVTVPGTPGVTITVPDIFVLDKRAWYASSIL